MCITMVVVDNRSMTYVSIIGITVVDNTIDTTLTRYFTHIRFIAHSV